MGNDEQINQHDLERGKSLFLPPEIKDEDGVRLVKYSLEEEYRKSKKNVAWKVYIVLGLFIFILGTLAYASQLYFRYTDSRKEIVVTEFEGENLKEILESTRNAEKNLSRSRDELHTLQEKMKAEIAALREEGAKKREEIKNQDISGREKASLIAQQKKDEEEQVDSVAEKYDTLLEEKKKEIAENEKQVSESRKKMDEGVTKANKMLSNSERLTQMRLDEQKRHYEDLLRRMLALYDPEFSGKDVRKILRGGMEKANSDFELKAYSRDMRLDGDLSEDEYKKLKSMSENFQILVRAARSVPYKNSMSGTIRHLENFHNAMMDRYEQFGNALLETNRYRKNELAAFNYAFENMTKKSPETGYIVDPRDEEAIVVYVNPVVLVNNGFRAKVFRRDDEEIGEIEFLPGKKGRLARVISLTPEKKLQPFDRVLIEYKR